MNPDVSYTHVYSTRASRRHCSFRSDKVVAADVAPFVKSQQEDPSPVDEAQSSDSASLYSVDDRCYDSQVESDNDEHCFGADETAGGAVSPHRSSGPLCIVAKSRRKRSKKGEELHLGNHKLDQNTPAASSSASVIASIPDHALVSNFCGRRRHRPLDAGANSTETPPAKRRQIGNFTSQTMTLIRNRVETRPGTWMELWKTLGEELGCSALAVSNRWMRYRKETNVTSEPSAVTDTAVSDAATTSQSDEVETVAIIRSTESTSAAFIKSLSTAINDIAKSHSNAFNHGTINICDVEYLLRCIASHAQNNHEDVLVELWLQLGTEFGVSIGAFLNMWTSFLRRAYVKCKIYLMAEIGSSVLDQAEVLVSARTLFSGENDPHILQRVAEWNGKGRGLWESLATHLHCSPELVMSRWTHLQLHADVSATLAGVVAAPQSSMSSSSSCIHAPTGFPVSAPGLTYLDWSEQEILITVNAFKLFPDLVKQFPVYLAAKLQRAEHEVRASLLRIALHKPGLSSGHKVENWYRSRVGSSPAENALLVRAVLQSTKKHNGLVLWDEIVLSLAIGANALKHRWYNQLGNNAKLLYDALPASNCDSREARKVSATCSSRSSRSSVGASDTGNCITSASQAPDVLHSMLDAMITAVELQDFTDRSNTGKSSSRGSVRVGQFNITGLAYERAAKEVRLCTARLDEKRRSNRGWIVLRAPSSSQKKQKGKQSSRYDIWSSRRTPVVLTADMELSQSEVDTVLYRISDANKLRLPQMPVVLELAATFHKSAEVFEKALWSLISSNPKLRRIISREELRGMSTNNPYLDHMLIKSILQSAATNQGRVDWTSIDANRNRSGRERWQWLVQQKVQFLYRRICGNGVCKQRGERAHAAAAERAITKLSADPSATMCVVPAATTTIVSTAVADPEVSPILIDMLAAVELSFFRGGKFERLGHPISHEEAVAVDPGLETVAARRPRQHTSYKKHYLRKIVQEVLDRTIHAIENVDLAIKVPAKRRFTEQEDTQILLVVAECGAANKSVDWPELDQQLSRNAGSSAKRWVHWLAALYSHLCTDLIPRYQPTESTVTDHTKTAHLNLVQDEAALLSGQVRQQVQGVLKRILDKVEKPRLAARGFSTSSWCAFTAQEDEAIVSQVTACNAKNIKIGWTSLDKQLGRAQNTCYSRWVRNLAHLYPHLSSDPVPRRKSNPPGRQRSADADLEDVRHHREDAVLNKEVDLGVEVEVVVDPLLRRTERAKRNSV